MIRVSEVYKNKPNEYKNELQEFTYSILSDLGVDFERVENEPAITMEDCVAIDEKLDVSVIKTLFLCNRQKTNFYLFVTPGDKPFVTKNFGKALGVSRVSFADEKLLNDIMGVEIGATTVFGIFRDEAKDVRLVFDKDVLNNDYYGCTDGTTTGYMKIKMDDVINKIIPYTNHELEIIEV